MNQPDSRVAELIEKHLAGGLDPAGTAELRQALADRPELARHVYEAARMHRCLQTSLGTAAQSGHARGGTRVPRRFRRFPALALAAAAAFVLGVFAWQALVWEPRAPSEPLVETKAPAAVGQARSEGLLVTRDTRETALLAGAPPLRRRPAPRRDAGRPRARGRQFRAARQRHGARHRRAGGGGAGAS